MPLFETNYPNGEISNQIYTFMKYIPIICLIFLYSCSTSKQTYKARTDRDSTATELLKDSLAVVRLERDHFEAKVRELESQVVEFDTTACPPIPEIHCPGLNTDSVNAVISRLNALYSGAMNKVKISTDGQIEAEGRLRSYRKQAERESAVMADKDRLIDSLRRVSAERKVEVRTVQAVTEKKKKRDWFIYLAIGLVLGWVLRSYLRRIIGWIRPVKRKAQT